MGLKQYLEKKKANKFRNKHKIGLCLSGGGARGFAYLGAFKAFEEYGIKFDAVAGCSIGSVMGAVYASGIPLKEIIEKTKEISTKDFRHSKLGFLPSKMDRLSETIKSILPVKKIEDLEIPFGAVAVDVKTGNEVHFTEGELVPIITGSCAIPGVFVPVKHKGMVLVDGGVINNVPADILLDMGCDYIVTIDCNSTRGEGTSSASMISQFFASVGIMMAKNSKRGQELSDILICPDMQKFSSLKIENKEAMIKEGYRATKEMMPEIISLFNGKLKKIKINK